MGEVFVARKRGTGDFEKHVALKLLLPHLTSSPTSVKRFYDEASLAARMRHPNIVEIFDVGEAEGRPFIAMQLVEGVSLNHYLRTMQERALTVPLPIVRAIALAICEALAYAHSLRDLKGEPLNVVHRDVTPSNVLLSFTGAIQLTDFGIARIGADTTSTGVRGKAAYVAPEQLSREVRVDARADLYAAALTLYELASGRSPFRRKTQEATLQAVLEGNVPPLSEVRSDVSAQMSDAVMKGLSRHPSSRFNDATAFRKAVIDGPVASAPELAEHLRALFVSSRPKVIEEGPGTKSQVLRVTRSVPVSTDPTISHPLPGSRRWPLVVTMVSIGALALALAGAWGVSRTNVGGAPRTEAPVPTQTFTAELPPVPPTAVDIVTPGVPETVVTEEESSQPPTVRPVPRPVRPAKPAAEPKAPVPNEPQIGFLAADAEPWADVLVDGARVDRTPFSKYPLPAGKHVVVLRAPDGREEKRTVTVAQGKTTSVRATFPAP